MPPKMLDYASPGTVYKPRTSRLAMLVMVLVFLPFLVDGALCIVWPYVQDPVNGISNLFGLAVFVLGGAAVQIASHTVALAVCIVARSRMRAAPERYRRLWVGTLAAVMCYGMVILDGVAIAMVIFKLR